MHAIMCENCTWRCGIVQTLLQVDRGFEDDLQPNPFFRSIPGDEDRHLNVSTTPAAPALRRRRTDTVTFGARQARIAATPTPAPTYAASVVPNAPNPLHGTDAGASSSVAVNASANTTASANVTASTSVRLVTPKPLLHSLRFSSPSIGAFRHAVNPATRTAQFCNLKDTHLYDNIKKLPEWEQMQELSP